MPKLSRKQKRRLAMQEILDQQANFTSKFSPKEVTPLTDTQDEVFNEYDKGQHLFLYGYAGTGKTFLSCYLAIKDILDNNRYNKLVIVRSAVAGRDVGHLPGKLEDKTAVFEEPYNEAFGKLFNRGDAYQILKQKMTVDFMTTSFIRGITLDNCIVIVDECQNMSDHEMHSIITRLGNNSKLIVCGDLRQSDLWKEESGFRMTAEIFSKMSSLSMIQFRKEDIVRSGFVKEYIIAREYVRSEDIQDRSSGISSAQARYYKWEKALQAKRRYNGPSLPVSNINNVAKV